MLSGMQNRVCLKPATASLGWIAKPVGMAVVPEIPPWPSFQKACEWLSHNRYAPESDDKSFWVRAE